MRPFSTLLTPLMLSASLLVSGCFERGAPNRETVVNQLPIPAELRASVTVLNLSVADGAAPAALTDFPESLADCPALRRVSFRNRQGLAELPTALTSLPGLVELDLAATGLQTLPEDLSGLTSLRNLYLGDNRLPALPPGVTTLPALRYLNLDRNALTALPESVGNLRALRWVRLNGNRLTALPDSAVNWKDVRRLYLRGNRLTEFPPQILEMTSLEQLDLGDNDLTSLPEALCEKLPNLERIDLDGNKRLKHLPADFAKMPALRHVFLYGTGIDSNEIARIRKDAPDRVRFFIAF